MATTRQPPADWELELEVTYYDTVMEREYTRLVYRHASDDLVVRITDVQEPNSFEEWRYLVRASGSDPGVLGIVADIEEAKDAAMEFIDGDGA